MALYATLSSVLIYFISLINKLLIILVKGIMGWQSIWHFAFFLNLCQASSYEAMTFWGGIWNSSSKDISGLYALRQGAKLWNQLFCVHASHSPGLLYLWDVMDKSKCDGKSFSTVMWEERMHSISQQQRPWAENLTNGIKFILLFLLKYCMILLFP